MAINVVGAVGMHVCQAIYTHLQRSVAENVVCFLFPLICKMPWC